MNTIPTSKRYSFNATVFTVAVLISLSSLVANAADIFWTDSTATYNNPANWGGTIPGTADNAINNNGSNNIVQINNGDPDWTIVDLQAGSATGTSGAFAQN